MGSLHTLRSRRPDELVANHHNPRHRRITLLPPRPRLTAKQNRCRPSRHLHRMITSHRVPLKRPLIELLPSRVQLRKNLILTLPHQRQRLTQIKLLHPLPIRQNVSHLPVKHRNRHRRVFHHHRQRIKHVRLIARQTRSSIRIRRSQRSRLNQIFQNRSRHVKKTSLKIAKT